MTVIDTSSADTSTAYSNQRKIDRCQNGVLWAFFYNGSGTLEGHVSTDNGATFSPNMNFAAFTAGYNYTVNFSIFIDLDDYCHLVYKDKGNGYIYYRRGTPNAARTAWTWSAAIQVGNFTVFDYPDIVVHREGTGWRAHVIFSLTSNNNVKAYYHPIEISSSGTITSLGRSNLSDTMSAANNVPGWPSIDFHHTGDGKTVKDGAPHLFVAWSAGATGAGKGIRFKKATYSGGSWTWGTEREIDSEYYVPSDNFWINCVFDGTRVLITGWLYTTNTSGAIPRRPVLFYERNVADTTTLGPFIVSPGDQTPTGSGWAGFGQSTYDSEGNVYCIGMTGDGSSEVNLWLWERATASVTKTLLFTLAGGAPRVSTKRGYSNNLIEFVYTDGTASPYNVTYGAITLNTEPNLPTNLQVTSLGTDTTPTFSADISDPETAQQIKARFEVQTLAGTSLGTLDSAFRTGAGTVTAEWANALALGQYQVRAKTIDDAGLESAYTAWLDFAITVAAPPKDLSLLWNVTGTIPKDLSLLWNITLGNSKDLGLIWNTIAFEGKELTLLWNKKTPWREVTEDLDIWRKVYL